jgi:glycosyltransferase involved in cell wall biosynthesis
MILNVSRLAPVKGQDMLLEAFSQLNDKDTCLVLIGEDWGLKKELEAKAKSLGIDDKVIFTGKVSEELLLSAYAAAGMFVLSSRLEPFGIVLLEAMACGIPVVATRVGGIPSVVGDCAWLCEPTTSSIKSGMTEMLKDEKKRKTASECGLNRAKKFDWSETAKKVDSIYKKIT